MPLTSSNPSVVSVLLSVSLSLRPATAMSAHLQPHRRVNLTGGESGDGVLPQQSPSLPTVCLSPTAVCPAWPWGPLRALQECRRRGCRGGDLSLAVRDSTGPPQKWKHPLLVFTSVMAVTLSGLQAFPVPNWGGFFRHRPSNGIQRLLAHLRTPAEGEGHCRLAWEWRT